MAACLKYNLHLPRLWSSRNRGAISWLAYMNIHSFESQDFVCELLSDGGIPDAHWPLLASAHWWTECPLSVPWLCGCWCSLSHSEQLGVKERKEPSETFLGYFRHHSCSPLFCSSAANIFGKKRPTLCLHKVLLSSVTQGLLMSTFAMPKCACFVNAAEMRENPVFRFHSVWRLYYWWEFVSF